MTNSTYNSKTFDAKVLNLDTKSCNLDATSLSSAINSKTFDAKVLNLDTKSCNPDTKVLSTDELVAAIMSECKAATKRAARKYGAGNMEDLEGFLIANTWRIVSAKEEKFHTMCFIRRVIKQRTMNHIARDVMPNQTLGFTVNEDGSTYEETIPDRADMELSNTLTDFQASLSAQQRKILDLVTQGYGNNEICDMVGCSINTPKNTMKKIKELAIQFGL
ncbi:LuxR C-terminal-related transcriptional regulator [Paenibacillus sp. Soil724D2]|uniref:LuxR C-terminal-related transcriptional regulator n=1 Tax=Paenibacillus sp. (strain Soil724D2) TaxID=1736392 RepID=UPI000712F712|nr:LuxR C-terminal-related transcriptional regulator [Paenibacillus sp. Soil724D2]KRE33445.1 hypothetical protein ASG85_14355 [Paenibacillus sp. Soil724D2]